MEVVNQGAIRHVASHRMACSVAPFVPLVFYFFRQKKLWGYTFFPTLSSTVFKCFCWVLVFYSNPFFFLYPFLHTGSLEERGLHKSISLWPSTSGDNTRRGQDEQLAQTYSLPPVVARFFPTVYPFTQLCPPPSETVVITEGENHKLLPVRSPVTDGEQGLLPSTENHGSEPGGPV